MAAEDKAKPRRASPDWKPRKISYPARITGVFGGITIGRISLPAISMHIEACRDTRKPIVVHDSEAA